MELLCIGGLLVLSSAKLTARDLIAERVRSEVDRKLLDQDGHTAPVLVTPTDKETKLNQTALNSINGKARKLIDADKQVDVALRAFDANGFVLLVDDTQIETLDEKIEMTPETVVTFLKLTPLVGG